MTKRILAGLLALVLLALLIPTTPVRAATQEDTLLTCIGQQYDAYVSGLDARDATETAMRLVSHSLKGGGKLNMGANDPFTAGILRTKLFRDAVLRIVARAAAYTLNQQKETVIMRGAVHWYNDSARYGVYIVPENSYGAEDRRLFDLGLKEESYTGSTNGYDDAMMLVVGTCYVDYSVQWLSTTEDTITYLVTFKLSDTFDFSGADYSSSYYTDLEKLITYLGKLLSMGLLETFDWSASGEMTLEVPNFCSHESENYRWERNDDLELVSVSGAGLTGNILRKDAGWFDESNNFRSTVYATEKSIWLRHDLPWELEFRSKNTGSMALAPGYHSFEEEPYLKKLSGAICFGEILDTQGNSDQVMHQYGVCYNLDGGLDEREYHTYRLVNEVLEDGTNRIRLYIDDVDYGIMDQIISAGQSISGTDDWAFGRNYLLSFIGNATFPIQVLEIEYIQVWENGRDREAFDFCTTSYQAPSCQEEGCCITHCSMCGMEIREAIPVSDHQYGDWIVTREATMWATGEQVRYCEGCGLEERVKTPKLDPPAGDATCDGLVNALDVILLRQYLAGWDVEIHNAGDANGDGSVNALDVILLRQYLAGWDVTLGPTE